MNEQTITEILKVGAEAAVQHFAKTGVEPTMEAVSIWVTANWEKLAEGMAQGVQMAVKAQAEEVQAVEVVEGQHTKIEFQTFAGELTLLIEEYDEHGYCVNPNSSEFGEHCLY